MQTFALVVLLASAIDADTLTTLSKLQAKRTVEQYNQVEDLVAKLRQAALSAAATAAKLAVELNEDVDRIEEIVQKQLENLAQQADEDIDELTSESMELDGEVQECIQNKTSSINEVISETEQKINTCIDEYYNDTRMRLSRLSNYVRKVLKVCDQAFKQARSCTDGNNSDKAICLNKAFQRSETKITVHSGELFVLVTSTEFRVSYIRAQLDVCVEKSIAEAKSRRADLINDIGSCVQTPSKET